MAKTAIIIDEMPNNCEECIAFAYLGYGSKKWCDAIHKELPDDCDERKPKWCRAKKIPEKLTEAADKLDELKKNNIDPNSGWCGWMTDIAYESGWNNCIDKITGEEG